MARWMFQNRYEPETNPYDDVDYRMWNYYRDCLRDQSGNINNLFDKDIASHNRYSGAKLNLTYGGYYNTSSPYIYDGTWTWGDMNRDNRGWWPTPRFDEMVRINANEYQNYPFTDSLVHTDEHEQDPGERNDALKWWLDYLRSTRMNFFETSRSNLIKGTTLYNNVSVSEKIVDQISRTPQKTLYFRSTKNLSNDVALPGHRSVPGHRYTVSRYGFLEGMAPLLPHKSAMKIYQYDPEVFDDSHLMSSVASKLRKLSESRSIIEKIITENYEDSKSQDPRSIKLASDIIALMGLTEYELRDQSSTMEPSSQPELKLRPNATKLIETLMDMPDSTKRSLSSSLLSHINNILSTPRRLLSNISYSHEPGDTTPNAPGSRAIPEYIQSVLKYTRGTQTPANSKQINMGKTPGLSPPVSTTTQQSILLRDSSKKAVKYSTKLPDPHTKVDPEYIPGPDIRKAQVYASKLLNEPTGIQPSYDVRVGRQYQIPTAAPPEIFDAGPRMNVIMTQELNPYQK